VADCRLITPAGAARTPWRIEGNTICGNRIDVEVGPTTQLPGDRNTICGPGSGTSAVPAASARATVAPAVTMTAEPVAPGVDRVRIRDGERQLRGDWSGGVAVGPDGWVWVLGPDGIARIGGDGVIALPWSVRGLGGHDLTVAPDGSTWLVTAPGHLARFDSSGWTTFAAPDHGTVTAVEAGPDGSIWALSKDARNQPAVARLGEDGWAILPAPPGCRYHLAVDGGGVP